MSESCSNSNERCPSRTKICSQEHFHLALQEPFWAIKEHIFASKPSILSLRSTMFTTRNHRPTDISNWEVIHTNTKDYDFRLDNALLAYRNTYKTPIGISPCRVSLASTITVSSILGRQEIEFLTSKPSGKNDFCEWTKWKSFIVKPMKTPKYMRKRRRLDMISSSNREILARVTMYSYSITYWGSSWEI